MPGRSNTKPSHNDLNCSPMSFPHAVGGNPLPTQPSLLAWTEASATCLSRMPLAGIHCPLNETRPACSGNAVLGEPGGHADAVRPEP